MTGIQQYERMLEGVRPRSQTRAFALGLMVGAMLSSVAWMIVGG